MFSIIAGGVRVGVYPSVRDSLMALSPATGTKAPTIMILSGSIAGAISYGLGSPFALVKTLKQSELCHPPPSSQTRRHTSALHTLRSVSSSEGVVGLFRGSHILVVRGSLIGTGHLFGYDVCKTHVKSSDMMADGPALHLLASLWGCFCAVTLGTPADVIMTNFMTAGHGHGERVRSCIMYLVCSLCLA